MSLPAPAQDADIDVVDALARFFNKPLGFVYFAFPWGQPHTQLANEAGPDYWQIQVLKELEDCLERGMDPGSAVKRAIRIAVKSGHGVGKTALVAWIILWFMSTRPHPQVVVTANTSAQLSGKTWRELAKWHKMSTVFDLFQWTATSFYAKHAPETWRANAVPWSKERSEAFAGTHERYVLIIFDEASAIEDIIYEVAEGAMTTEGAMWICFGNPTRNTGYFRDFWREKLKGRWRLLTVDSRQAKKANQDEIAEWIKYYGDDSDFVRIRVLGEFPRVSSNQFISEELVQLAAARIITPEEYRHAPLVLGVDVAYFGDDRSIGVLRQGNALHKAWKWPEMQTDQLAHEICWIVDEYQENGKPIDKVFIERVGIGVGTFDTMKTQGYEPFGVQPGGKAMKERQYMNKRAEMWDATKRWLVDAQLRWLDASGVTRPGAGRRPDHAGIRLRQPRPAAARARRRHQGPRQAVA